MADSSRVESSVNDSINFGQRTIVTVAETTELVTFPTTLIRSLGFFLILSIRYGNIYTQSTKTTTTNTQR